MEVFQWFDYFLGGKDLSQKTVFITGAASGIGKATARLLAHRGDRVILCDVDASCMQLAQELRLELSALDGVVASSKAKRSRREFRCVGFQMDVTSETSVLGVRSEVEKKGWRLDAIVNCAGVLVNGPHVALASESTSRALEINVAGTARVNRVFFPLLNRQQRPSSGGPHPRYFPRIICMGSEISLVGLSAAFNGVYALTKAALESYAVSLRQELTCLDSPVLVAVVNPGAMQTPLLESNLSANSLRNVASHLYSPKLLAANQATIEGYLHRNAKPPLLCAAAMHGIIHSLQPARNTAVNLSLEMKLVRWTPQWVLDLVMKLKLSPPRFVW